jgi:very-short-patch-repair endonuclease
MNFYPYNANLKRLSRQLRGKSTDAEKLLWSKIRRKQINGYQFSRQKPIGNYIVDFYCKEARLVIEIDGGQHYEERSIKKDKAREAFFKQRWLAGFAFY